MILLNNILVGPVARLPWRVQTKLLVAFLAIVALLIALGGIGIYELSAVNQRTEKLMPHMEPIVFFTSLDARKSRTGITARFFLLSIAFIAFDDSVTLDSDLGVKLGGL